MRIEYSCDELYQYMHVICELHWLIFVLIELDLTVIMKKKTFTKESPWSRTVKMDWFSHNKLLVYFVFVRIHPTHALCPGETQTGRKIEYILWITEEENNSILWKLKKKIREINACRSGVWIRQVGRGGAREIIQTWKYRGTKHKFKPKCIVAVDFFAFGIMFEMNWEFCFNQKGVCVCVWGNEWTQIVFRLCLMK